MGTSRRQFLKGAGAVTAASTIGGFPLVARAQALDVRIGVVAIRAGIAAPVGIAGLRRTEWWAERVNETGGILGRQVKRGRRRGVEPEGHRRALCHRLLGRPASECGPLCRGDGGPRTRRSPWDGANVAFAQSERSG